MPTTNLKEPDATPLWLLRLGLILGGLVAAASVIVEVGYGPTALPDAAAARVDSQLILTEDLEMAVTVLAADRSEGPTPELQHAVLDRLIDEELLVARALALGLARSDPSVRKSLVAAMIESLNAQSQASTPTDLELKALYEAEADRFNRVTALEVDVMLLATADAATDSRELARSKLEEARQSIVGGASFSDVRQELNAELRISLPKGLLAPSTLANLTVPDLAAAAVQTPRGGLTPVISSQQGAWLALVIDSRSQAITDRLSIRSELEALWRRQRDDEILRTYLDELRREATIRIGPAGNAQR